jgi:hypothetical protein
VRFTEMSLRAKGAARVGVDLAESIINSFESLFPMLSGGLVLHVHRL